MAVFGSSDELYEIVVPFLEELTSGSLKDRYAAVKATVRVHYTDPDGFFHLDTTAKPPTFATGDAASARPADIVMTMSADDGHLLWLGELNVTKAVAARRIEVTGPMMKLLTLLPAVKSSFAVYRDYLERTGRGELLRAAG